MAVGIVHDLAVGVHPAAPTPGRGRTPSRTACRSARPPDTFNAHGQDWGLPPWRPDALAASGYAPFRAPAARPPRHAGRPAHRPRHGPLPPLVGARGPPAHRGRLRRLRRRGDARRPRPGGAPGRGRRPRRGPGHRRAGCGGARPARGARHLRALVRARLGRHGRPLAPEKWRATASPRHHPRPAVHRGPADRRPCELRHRLGLLTRPLDEELAEDAADAAEWLAYLARLRLLPEGGGGDEEAAVRAVHRFLLRTPARMAGVWLPDTVGDRRPQNLPGTWDQYPNWRLPVADAEGRPRHPGGAVAASPRLHGAWPCRARRRARRPVRHPRARAPQAFATFAPWTRRTLCAPAPWRPVRR